MRLVRKYWTVLGPGSVAAMAWLLMTGTSMSAPCLL
jgi:hypothetical protein